MMRQRFAVAVFIIAWGALGVLASALVALASGEPLWAVIFISLALLPLLVVGALIGFLFAPDMSDRPVLSAASLAGAAGIAAAVMGDLRFGILTVGASIPALIASFVLATKRGFAAR